MTQKTENKKVSNNSNLSPTKNGEHWTEKGWGYSHSSGLTKKENKNKNKILSDDNLESVNGKIFYFKDENDREPFLLPFKEDNNMLYPSSYEVILEEFAGQSKTNNNSHDIDPNTPMLFLFLFFLSWGLFLLRKEFKRSGSNAKEPQIEKSWKNISDKSIIPMPQDKIEPILKVVECDSGSDIDMKKENYKKTFFIVLGRMIVLYAFLIALLKWWI